MKLVGSKTEKEFEAELIRNTSLVFGDSIDSYVKTFFIENEIEFNQILVLESFPDDRSIFYWLLVSR